VKIGSLLNDVARSLFVRPATRRYPRERPAVPERLRGALRWNPARCTGCGMCIRDCPASALELITLDKASKRFVLRYHIDRCTFCGQCVQTCNFGCLQLANDRWALAALCREEFTIHYGDDADIEAVLGQHSRTDDRTPAQG
jgi:formate hydrogenlyase subunit 6/NADH:ubiquinone oxidoreductase subunit I